MLDHFKPLVEALREQQISVTPFQEDTAQAEAIAPEVSAEWPGLLRELALFRARVAEAVEAATETILADIAAEVLARELQLAPADISAVVRRALKRYADDEPLRVRVHPCDAALLSCGIPVVQDESLRAGDVRIELRCGAVDGTLGVRLDAVLQRSGA